MVAQVKPVNIKKFLASYKLVILFSLLFVLETCIADSSFLSPMPVRAQTQKTTIDNMDAGCFHKYSNQALIEAQRGVGDTDQAYTGRCPNGYVGVEGYTWLRVRERGYGGAPEYRWLLRAVSSKAGILCCPLQNVWVNS